MMSRMPMSPLGTHIEFLTSGSRGWQQYYSSSGALFLRIQNVGRNRLSLDDVAYVSVSEGAETARTQVKPDDVLLSITADLGRSAVVPRGLGTAYINQHLALIRAPSICSGYLSWYLCSDFGMRQIAKRDRGGVKSGLNFDDIKSLEIPLPPFAEQLRVAEILDKADAIRRKRQEAIALTEQLLRSTFLEMFGDAAKHGWAASSVEQLAHSKHGSIRTGPFGSDLRHSEFVDGGIAVLGIDNAVENEFTWGEKRFITQSKYEDFQRYRVFPGDIIITIMGTCGRCAIIPDDLPLAINTKHLCCITLDRGKCLPEFLHSYFLFHPDARAYLEQRAKGAIMDGLNMGIIRALPAPIAPMELQFRYQAFSVALAGTKKRLIAHARHSDDLFNSLVQRAFSGQL